MNYPQLCIRVAKKLLSRDKKLKTVKHPIKLSNFFNAIIYDQKNQVRTEDKSRLSVRLTEFMRQCRGCDIAERTMRIRL